MIVLDLMWASNKVQTDPQYETKFFPIYIDEFGDFFVEGFTNFLKKCGSAGYCLHLACQSFGDLEDKNILDQVVTNTRNRIVINQVLPKNVDMLSKIFGTFSTGKKTVKTESGKETEFGTITIGNEFKIDPELINELPNGSAIFNNKSQIEVIDLALTENFVLKGERSYFTENEKKDLLNEIEERAKEAQVSSKKQQDINIYSLKNPKINATSKGQKGRKQESNANFGEEEK